MNVDGYELENAVKLERARELAGTGVDDAMLLALYDKLGGRITKGGQQIKTGCFWDTKAKKPAETPKVVYLYSVSGVLVEVPEGTELPGMVRAQMILDEEAAKETEVRAAKKGSRSGKKAAAQTEDLDEEDE